jgi:hypothetical protein
MLFYRRNRHPRVGGHRHGCGRGGLRLRRASSRKHVQNPPSMPRRSRRGRARREKLEKDERESEG